jgi:hypothetical protein
MKTFAEQLQEYVNAGRNERLNRQRFLKTERIKYLGHLFDLLRILDVIKDEDRSSHPLTAWANQHTLAFMLVNKYYKDPR